MAHKIAKLNYKDQKSFVNGRRFYYVLRNIWGVLLAVVLVASISFQFILAYLIGRDMLDYSDYKEFLAIITGGNFVQVIGLCVVVVNYLFPKEKNND